MKRLVKSLRHYYPPGVPDPGYPWNTARFLDEIKSGDTADYITECYGEYPDSWQYAERAHHMPVPVAKEVVLAAVSAIYGRSLDPFWALTNKTFIVVEANYAERLIWGYYNHDGAYYKVAWKF